MNSVITASKEAREKTRDMMRWICSDVALLFMQWVNWGYETVLRVKTIGFVLIMKEYCFRNFTIVLMTAVPTDVFFLFKKNGS